MFTIDQSSVSNHLLRNMVAADFALLSPYLERVYQHDRAIIKHDTEITDLFFPESGVVSVVKANKTTKMEIRLIGREGLVGATPVLLGSNRSSFDFLIQMPGDHYKVERRHFLQAVDTSPTLKLLLLRYVQTFILQIAETAFANAAYVIEVRLARWLLMCHDRVLDDRLPITHASLAMMLGVRRAGVTEALHLLEGRQLIKATRGLIAIMDRPGLRSLAGESYGIAESSTAA